MNEKPPEKTGLGLKNSPSRSPDNVHGFSWAIIAPWLPARNPRDVWEMQNWWGCNVFSCLGGVKCVLEIQFKLNQLLNKQQKYTWWIFTLSNCLSLVGKGIWFIKAGALLSLGASIDSQGTHRSTEKRITPTKTANFGKRISCWNDRGNTYNENLLSQQRERWNRLWEGKGESRMLCDGVAGPGGILPLGPGELGFPLGVHSQDEY